MAFSTKKRAGKYIKTSFGTKDYDPLESTYSQLLIDKLQQGSPDAIKPLIISHIKLGIKIAGQYAYKPSSDQELVSVAFEAIVDGCMRVFEGKDIPDNNLTGYLVSLIHSRCNRFVCENRIVRIPASSLIKAKKQGLHVKIPLQRRVRVVPDKKTSVYDLREVITLSCLTDRDRKIIKLREYLYNNTEIATVLGITKVRVGQLLRNIEGRFNQRMESL